MTVAGEPGRTPEPDEPREPVGDMHGQKAAPHVVIRIDGAHLTVQPKIRARRTLAELLERTDPVPARTAEEETWPARTPVGRELQ